MESSENWFLGGFSAVLGIAGLFVAAHAGEGVGYYGGIAMFVFCVLFVMHLIKTGTAHGEGSSH